jgi:hypothetical protein
MSLPELAALLGEDRGLVAKLHCSGPTPCWNAMFLDGQADAMHLLVRTWDGQCHGKFIAYSTLEYDAEQERAWMFMNKDGSEEARLYMPTKSSKIQLDLYGGIWTLAEYRGLLDALCAAMDLLSGVTAVRASRLGEALKKRQRYAPNLQGTTWQLGTYHA